MDLKFWNRNLAEAEFGIELERTLAAQAQEISNAVANEQRSRAAHSTEQLAQAQAARRQELARQREIDRQAKQLAVQEQVLCKFVQKAVGLLPKVTTKWTDRKDVGGPTEADFVDIYKSQPQTSNSIHARNFTGSVLWLSSMARLQIDRSSDNWYLYPSSGWFDYPYYVVGQSYRA